MRTYPESGVAAHLFGYTGEVQPTQLQKAEFAAGVQAPSSARPDSSRSTTPSSWARTANEVVIINSRGREIDEDEKERQEPVDGKRVQLTIDADMQRALEHAFHVDGFNGAAAFIDPRSGEVLAMTSLPAYDPNDFASGISSATWAALQRPLRPLGNRLIQGLSLPGSTFKIVMAVTALEEGHHHARDGHRSAAAAPPSTVDTSSAGTTAAMAPWTLRHAIEQSCNVFFYTLGERLNSRFGDKSIDVINKWATKLGLVGKTGIDLPDEKAGFMASTEWAAKTRSDGRWYLGETVSVAIGQGVVSVSPIAWRR